MFCSDEVDETVVKGNSLLVLDQLRETFDHSVISPASNDP